MNIEMMLNPTKFGMEQCPHCNGYGSSLKESSLTCTRCCGSGLIKAKNDKRKFKVRAVETNYIGEIEIEADSEAEAEEVFRQKWSNGETSVVDHGLEVKVEEELSS